MAQRTIHTVFTEPKGWLCPAATAHLSAALHGNPGPKTSPKFSSFVLLPHSCALLETPTGRSPGVELDRGCWQKPSRKSTVFLFLAKVFFHLSLSPNFQWPSGKGKPHPIQAQNFHVFFQTASDSPPSPALRSSPLLSSPLHSEVVPFWGNPACPAQPSPTWLCPCTDPMLPGNPTAAPLLLIPFSKQHSINPG